jgi:hypothetical protein
MLFSLQREQFIIISCQEQHITRSFLLQYILELLFEPLLSGNIYKEKLSTPVNASERPGLPVSVKP